MKTIVLMIAALLMVHVIDANHQHRRFNSPFSRFYQEPEHERTQDLSNPQLESKTEFSDYVEKVGNMAPVIEQLKEKQQEESINRSEQYKSTLRKKLLYVGAGLTAATGVVAGVVWLCVKKGLFNKTSEN